MAQEKIDSRLAKVEEIKQLQMLSTESLIIWVIGKSQESNIIMTIEEITLECWKINPTKHSLRGYPQYPDSFVIMKRIFDMKGRKGLLQGNVQNGFQLTEISKRRYADLSALINHGELTEFVSKNAADRSISSIEEAPYKRLKKTPAYEKFLANKLNEIVETDFLYFYGINWHTKNTIVENKIKNIDLIVKKFSEQDPILMKVQRFLNDEFAYVKDKLLKGN